MNGETSCPVLEAAPAGDPPLPPRVRTLRLRQWRAQHPRPAPAIRVGKALRGVLDRIIAASSRVPNGPVLDVRDFPWTAGLRAGWQAVRDEALAALAADRAGRAAVEPWDSLALWGYGFPVRENLARCPRTAALLAQVPGLMSAYLSVLEPGTHVPPHRGVTKGLITCHLGLAIPRDGDVRMRIGGRVMRWSEGETLVFDDSFAHEVWNETGGRRIVLLVQFQRPMRQPGRWIADALLAAIRRSAFVREARANAARWSAALRHLQV